MKDGEEEKPRSLMIRHEERFFKPGLLPEYA